MPKSSEKDAVSKVRKHVEPKDCFIWPDGNDGYKAINEFDPKSTGCAHWVAHKKNWNSGTVSSNGCNKKFLLRVPDIVRNSGSEVDPADVEVGNVWAILSGHHHCGIVCKVEPSKDSAKPIIKIKNCSSYSERGVVVSDWTKDFKAGGKFYQG
jgi:hypothetical protein